MRLVVRPLQTLLTPKTTPRAPTSGGQYHWVSEFAPRKYQKLLSYFLGWLSVLGWQVTTAGSAYITGTLIQGLCHFSYLPIAHALPCKGKQAADQFPVMGSPGLIVLNNPSYVSEAWHGTLLTIASVGLTLLFNVFLARKLPFIEGVLVVIHIFGFFGVVVTLWVLSPTGDAKTVFVRTLMHARLLLPCQVFHTYLSKECRMSSPAGMHLLNKKRGRPPLATGEDGGASAGAP